MLRYALVSNVSFILSHRRWRLHWNKFAIVGFMFAKGREMGERNLTHCWPHDKRWLVNKSKANANVSMLCPGSAAAPGTPPAAPGTSAAAAAAFPPAAAPPARYNVRKFLFATCTAFGRA